MSNTMKSIKKTIMALVFRSEHEHTYNIFKKIVLLFFIINNRKNFMVGNYFYYKNLKKLEKRYF